ELGVDRVGDGAVQVQRGPAVHVVDDLDVAGRPALEAGWAAEPRAGPRLDEGLLGRVPGGEACDVARPVRVGDIGTLTRGERLREQPRAGHGQLLGEVGDVHDVDADAEDAHLPSPVAGA